MAIKESDLFKGVSQRFITKVANNSEELNNPDSVREPPRTQNVLSRPGVPVYFI